MKLIIRILLIIFLPGYLQASVVVLNGLTHTHTIAGTDGKTQGVIRVRNDADKESRITVYRQDLISQCGQSATYPEAGSHNRSLGNYLKTNVDEKIIAGHEEYDVRYTIELEKEKVQAGTYWEVIMIEVGEPVSEKQKNGVQVNSKVRYAIQIIVDAGVIEGPQLSFENVVYEKVSAQQSVLKILLKNNSDFGTRTNVILEIYDAQGNKLKTTGPNTRMVYPGYCNVFEVPINEVPSGKYDCVIIADTGRDLFGSNISVQVE